ncbi:hypothetical protein Pth03_08100 [Planotetraspora thailandica]|uniref:Zinc finger CGNR domain-containing protein n=1 Tax=Planotetraspora thailandica TaxID=487172 RepID=A0A8J3UX31_9ACTN|nr:CGNR zinc finger domain-containing protein [Planotetraspora thailandica]GII52421.1 hypothetical protein Pth03_08100 [Planotetraspora thailandica]
MPWSATSRFELVPAPGALALVQDLLNTAATAQDPDLLADMESAQAWVSDATAEWSAVTGLPAVETVLDADGLQELRAFRDDLRDMSARAHEAASETGPVEPATHAGAAMLQLGADGSVRLQPQESDRRALVVLALAALFEGQQAGTRHRLKTCRNPRCRVAFYDRSRNVSGVWHSVRSCGNLANLHAHRERRRAE